MTKSYRKKSVWIEVDKSIMTSLSYQGASQATQNKFNRLVRRLTRFLVKMELTKAEKKLCTILNKLKLPFTKVSCTTSC